MKHLVFQIFLIFSVTTVYSQDLVPVAQFKSGDKVLSENIASFASNPDVTRDEIVDNLYFRYVQFNNIPSAPVQDELKSNGLHLIEYIPDNVYLVGFPRNYDTRQLLNYDIRSVVSIDIEDKLDLRLLDQTWPSWAQTEDGRVKVMLKTFPDVSRETFIRALLDAGVIFTKEDIHFPFIFSSLYPAEFLSIAGLPVVQFLDIGPDPGTPEDTGGRTLQRANLINNLLPGGLRYDGSGVNIQVRDDGVVGPHIDFEGRLFDYTGGANSGTHGDGVAGVFAGAGNLEQEVAGSASGANVYVTNYESTFTDNTMQLHQQENVVITNSSYSNGCNAGYTTTTQRVDQQMHNFPNLMHVFSAGNSNNNDCGYGAGNQWGNITGGHKQGKNVMAVANLFANGTLVSSSSRGPAHDGRIKPDISAHGQNERSTSTNNTYQTFGGTSSAAPTMAGSYAQLYQAYRSLNGGEDPHTGFLKAVVLNSAHDKGNIGPDFKFGWGRIDAYKGLEILEDQTYLEGYIVQGQIKNHTINIPANVAEARVMIYWADRAGAVNASKALVNDLDIHMTDPTSTRHDPWILDHTPDPLLLDLPASKGIDRLNNMEQVQIDNPVAGNYNLQISGTTIPFGSQHYFVVWSFFYDEIMVTYPLGGEGFVPNESTRIHWDAHGNQGSFTLEYSANNGGSWNTITSGLSGDTRLFSWNVPNIVSSEALVRVSRGGQSDQSDAPFAIILPPANLNFTNACKTGATLNWSAVNGADNYEVFQLGEKYMEIIATTNA
ncbi:MAG: S8 family serine peptidase, partial [Saprospiraceae bacterium]|nr:S8 family serine peptidase [Saprospiraceae bacterium]